MAEGDRLEQSEMWVWTRFRTCEADDWRPIYDKDAGHPGLGPYWCSGYAGDGSYATICAWVQPGEDVRQWWPEATDITQEDAKPMTFSDRFPQPDWWPR